jgi:hypothetical protein
MAGEVRVQIDKDTVINFLRSQGKHDEADRARHELPDKVDHEQHAGLLGKFGVDDPKQLLGKVPGVGKLLE